MSVNAPFEQGRGREAEAPGDIPLKGWKDIAWRLWTAFNEDRVLMIAGGGTFYVLLALVPALSALVSTYGLLLDSSTLTNHVELLSTFLPSGAMDIIREQLVRLNSNDNRTLSFAFLLSFAIALWSANAGMKGLFEAINVAYGEREKRNFFVLNAISLLFTLGGILLLILMIGVVIVAPVVLSFFYLGGFEFLVRIGGFLLLFAALIGGLAVLYRYGPSRTRARWHWLPPGAVVAAVLIVAVSLGFSFYVSNFANYNETYGSLGAIIGFMTLIWLTLTVVMLGAEINAEIEHQTTVDTTKAPEKPMGQRGAYMADTVGESSSTHKAEQEEAEAEGRATTR